MTHMRGTDAARASVPRRARIIDVAELAGVSMKTVSRVVNDEAGVLPDTRDRVVAAIAELGFVPDSRARSLKRGSTDTIGILIDAISDPFFAAFVSAVEELALAEGLSVLFASTGYDGHREREQLARLTGDRLRGLIVAPVEIGAGELQLLRRRFPVVCVDRAREGIDSIVVDDFGATVEAVEAFIERGHRRIGFIGEHTPYPTVSARFDGFRAALAAAGIPIDDSLVVEQGRSHEEHEVTELLGRPDAPTAVFCASSPATIATIHALRQGTAPMPALISFGDFEFASVFTPGITCVDQDPRLIGEATFRRLIALSDEPGSAPEHIVVPTRLIRRGSGELLAESEATPSPIGALR
ncbi:LacI family DNA-binding transcriptional regulator [Microbacterium sp. NPDC080220]|uniref:LacI family DNA-binding transcriptional regulator n=1 Tax=Microbacterium sp. NPDC080220 TaxID=3161017 RepID=UPI003448E52E